MLDLVKMIKFDLVMIEVQLAWSYKKGSNAVDIHHCARLKVDKATKLS